MHFIFKADNIVNKAECSLGLKGLILSQCPSLADLMCRPPIGVREIYRKMAQTFARFDAVVLTAAQ